MSQTTGTTLLSVIIPTHNRRDVLRQALDSLEQQVGLAGTFEVIVADDGSSDGTAEMLQSLLGSYSYSLRWIKLPHSGAAAARNRALSLATAARSLILGDDTFPVPGALASHMAAGESLGEVAVQGHIEWDPQAPVTPVMRFLAPHGPQFYFKGLKHGKAIPYRIVYGSNFSAPTHWFRDDPYDEGFRTAAFEDTELAFRWGRKGRKTIYWETALCYHRHHYESIEKYLERQHDAGVAARLAVALHPAMAAKTVLAPLAVALVHLAKYAGNWIRRNNPQEDRWDLQCRAAFFRGFLAGRNGDSIS